METEAATDAIASTMDIRRNKSVSILRTFRVAAVLCFAISAAVSAGEPTAVELLVQEANTGNPQAMFELGWIYRQGELGLDADPEMSWFWLQRAAEKGHPLAQLACSTACYNGHGVPPDKEKAAEWAKKAALEGNCRAISYLGSCYEAGEGVAKDPEKALKLYRMASEQGDNEAFNRIGNLYEKGIGVESSPQTAVRYYAIGASRLDPACMFDLARCYMTGTGLPKDLERGRAWLHRAALNGSEAARNVLSQLGEKAGDAPQVAVSPSTENKSPAVSLPAPVPASGLVASNDHGEPLRSPDGRSSVRIVKKPMFKTDDPMECFTLQVFSDDDLLRGVPTCGYITSASWSPNGRMVAVNNRRGNAGDYLWVFDLVDRGVPKRADDNLGEAWMKQGLDEISKARELPPGAEPYRSWLTAAGWTSEGKLLVVVRARYGEDGMFEATTPMTFGPGNDWSSGKTSVVKTE